MMGGMLPAGERTRDDDGQDGDQGDRRRCGQWDHQPPGRGPGRAATWRKNGDRALVKLADGVWADGFCSAAVGVPQLVFDAAHMRSWSWRARVTRAREAVDDTVDRLMPRISAISLSGRSR